MDVTSSHARRRRLAWPTSVSALPLLLPHKKPCCNNFTDLAPKVGEQIISVSLGNYIFFIRHKLARSYEPNLQKRSKPSAIAAQSAWFRSL